MAMKKLIVLFGLLTLSLLLQTQAGCGAGPICQTLIRQYCERLSQCQSGDPATQAQKEAECLRNGKPDTTCNNLTPAQKKELETMAKSGCHSNFSSCTCNGPRIDCGTTCTQAILNAFTALGI